MIKLTDKIGFDRNLIDKEGNKKEKDQKRVNTFDLLRELGAMDYKSLLSPLNLLISRQFKGIYSLSVKL